MEYKCECGKVVKSQSGLKRHKATCKATESKEEVEVSETITEVVSKPSDSSMADRVNRQINKLEDSIRSTFDAKARYDLECQIKELKKQLNV